MNKDIMVKVAIAGLATISGSGISEEQNPFGDIIPPRPIPEICQALEEAEDGEGLSQDIENFLTQLEQQGLIDKLHCDSAYEEDNHNENTQLLHTF